MPEVIFADKDRGLVVERSTSCPPDFVALLDGMVWGTGGVRYRMHGMAASLGRLREPSFFSLREDGALVAVATLNKKTVRLAGKDYPAFYSYALAVAAGRQGRGYGTLLAGEALRYGRQALGEKGIYYGFVEAGNIHSLRAITKVGRTSLGVFQTLLVSRLWPRDNAGVEKLDPRCRDEMVGLLEGTYHRYSLLEQEQSVRSEDYYLLRQGGEIVAGLQCEPHGWTICHLPGARGQLLVRLLPWLPVAGRLLPVAGRLLPEGEFAFLNFGNIFIRPGREVAIFTLMEAVLARHRRHFGMINVDPRSPMYRQLETVGRYGLFHRLINVPVHVMAYLQGFSDAEAAAIRRQPLFISLADPL